MASSDVSRLGADDEVIVVGAGAHTRSVLGVLADIGCRVIGLAADSYAAGTMVAGFPLLGGLANVLECASNHPQAGWVLAIGDNYHRLRILREIQAACPAAVFPPVVHPSCVVAGDVALEEGAALMPGSVLMAGCSVGAAALVNTRASLDHEGTLEEGASLAPGVITGGRVTVGRRSFVGLGSCIVQGVSVGADSVVGAGSLVLEDVPDRAVAYGRPARFVRNREPDEAYF